MSTASYKLKPYTTYYILYSYENANELVTGICPSLHSKSEKDALDEVTSNLLITYKPNFSAHVIGSKTW